MSSAARSSGAAQRSIGQQARTGSRRPPSLLSLSKRDCDGNRSCFKAGAASPVVATMLAAPSGRRQHALRHTGAWPSLAANALRASIMHVQGCSTVAAGQQQHGTTAGDTSTCAEVLACLHHLFYEICPDQACLWLAASGRRLCRAAQAGAYQALGGAGATE